MGPCEPIRRVRRLGVIGDVHAEDARLAIVLDALNGLDVDHVVAVGDIADGRGDLARCCALLTAVDATVVRGNHDRWLLDGTLRDLPHAHRVEDIDASTLSFIAKLPQTATLESPIGPVLVCHGLSDDDMDRLDPADPYGISQNPTLPVLRRAGFSLVARGHTHRRWAYDFDGVRVVNAGTLETEPGFVVVDLVDDAVRAFALDADNRRATITVEWESNLRRLPRASSA